MKPKRKRKVIKIRSKVYSAKVAEFHENTEKLNQLLTGTKQEVQDFILNSPLTC